MAEVMPSSTERARRESALRVAATVAGQREGWVVPQGLIDRIVAGIDWRLSQAELETRVASVIHQVIHDPSAPNFRDAPGATLDSYFVRRFGHLFPYYMGLAAALGEAREEAGERSAGSAAYDSALVSDDMITPGNYHRSRFGRCGIPHSIYDDLRGQGYTRDQIYNAGRQANLLGFRGDQRMIRAQALIQRYDNDAEGTNRALLAYREAIESDRELADLMARANGATGEERRQLEEQIRRRYQHLRETHGVEGRLTDPGNDERAKGGIRESDELIRRRREEERGFRFQFGAEAAQGRTDAELVAETPAPTPGEATHVTARADALFDEPTVVPATTTRQATDTTAAPERPGQGRQLAQNTAPLSRPTLTG